MDNDSKIINTPCTGKIQPCVFPDAVSYSGVITYQHIPMVFFDSNNMSSGSPNDINNCTLSDFNPYF
jgi:hypothetical protein